MKTTAIAPCRLSLFGGGTDLLPYSSKYGGVCINMAIDIRQKVTLSSKNELLPDDNPDFFKAFLGNAKVKHEFDAPIESGLGSSASLAVALVGLFAKGFLTKGNIAELAWKKEVYELGLYGGKQDQYAAVFGGINLMDFNDEVKVFPFKKKKYKFLNGLMLFYTGKNRKSSGIQEGFRDLTSKQVAALNDLKRIAEKAVDYIVDDDIQKIGGLLAETWAYKKDSNKGVTNKRIDKIYKTAIKAGALGGKIMGAGGGGHMLFASDPKNRERIIKSLEEIKVKHVPFKVDWEGLVVR